MIAIIKKSVTCLAIGLLFFSFLFWSGQTCANDDIQRILPRLSQIGQEQKHIGALGFYLGETYNDDWLPTWVSGRYAFFDIYDGCEIIQDDGNKKLVRPIGQDEYFCLQKDDNGQWTGDYPHFKADYPRYGY